MTPSPKALQKALAQSAKRAQLLAQAFGLTVPVERTKTKAKHVTDPKAFLKLGDTGYLAPHMQMRLHRVPLS